MLKSENLIVLVIDIQDKLISATNAYLEAENATKMVYAANVLNIPVVISEQYPKGLGRTCNSILEILKPDTKILEKTSFSFLREHQDVIKSSGKKQVILFGLETHICVMQTAIELLQAGLEVFIIKNACKSRMDYEYQAGIDLMQKEGAKILTLEIAFFELLGGSKHPSFKEIQALIK